MNSLLDNPAAFAPFYDATAVIAGKRQETGETASRLLSLGAPCCVLGGELVDAANGAIAPTIERAYTLLIPMADWPDHLPPQSGDIATIATYPIMRVSTCVPLGTDWCLTCLSKGGV